MILVLGKKEKISKKISILVLLIQASEAKIGSKRKETSKLKIAKYHKKIANGRSQEQGTLFLVVLTGKKNNHISIQ